MSGASSRGHLAGDGRSETAPGAAARGAALPVGVSQDRLGGGNVTGASVHGNHDSNPSFGRSDRGAQVRNLAPAPRPLSQDPPAPEDPASARPGRPRIHPTPAPGSTRRERPSCCSASLCGSTRPLPQDPPDPEDPSICTTGSPGDPPDPCPRIHPTGRGMRHSSGGRNPCWLDSWAPAAEFGYWIRWRHRVACQVRRMG